MDVEPPDEPGMTPQALEYASFAAALAEDGECERAGTEFRRAAHSSGSPGMAAWAHLRSGGCFYALERWEPAADEFLRAAAKAPAPAEQSAARRLAAACQFNDGNFAACEAVLLDADPSLDADPAALGILGLCDMATGRWSTARQRFTLALDGPMGLRHPSKLHYLIGETSKGERLPHRSPGLATALSMVVPGSGQMYCGRVQDGLRHLVFNAALIYTIVELARAEYYPAAYLVTGIELPFYIGNILGARRAARSFDRSARLSFLASVLMRTEP